MDRGTHIRVWPGAGVTIFVAMLWLWAAPVTAPVIAQEAVGEHGRALDASPQVGTGGINAPSGRIDFRVRNDLITGNVADSRAFRDTVGYVAPGEFRDRLGTDDLFRFRADSLASSPDRLDAVAAGRAYTRGAGTSVYRLHAQPHVSDPTLTTDLVPRDVSIGGYWEPARPMAPEWGDRLVGRGDVFDPMRGPRLVDRPAMLTPLLGVRADETEAWARPAPLDPREPDPQQDPQRDPQQEDPRADAPKLLDPAIDRPTEPEARLDTRVPGLLLGHYLLPPVGSDAEATVERLRADRALQAQLEQWGDRWIEERWTDRTEQIAPEAADPYARLLAAVQRADRVPEAIEPADDEPADPAPDEPLLELHEPSERDVQRAEQRRQATLELFQTEDAAARQATSEALEALLERLDYTLPRLESLAAEHDDAVTRLMRDAEQRLADGDYLEAERKYRRALAQRRDEPLARVGMVHAQLGAGMYRSAGMHLRHLFERYPELIAARYSARLLPEVDRLHAAQEQLERMIERGDRAAGPAALLLAYLGHQAGGQRVVRVGLAHAEALHPRDPLVPMLRRIWLGER